MVTGWSDGLQCRTFLAHYKRLHYLKVCGAVVEDPGKSFDSVNLIIIFRSAVSVAAFAYAVGCTVGRVSGLLKVLVRVPQNLILCTGPNLD